MVALVQCRHRDHLGVDAGELRGDVGVGVVVAGREHDDHVAGDGRLDRGAHTGMVTVHAPAAVDHVAARRIGDGLRGHVVDGIRSVLVHAGLQVDAQRHQPAAWGDTENAHGVVGGGDSARDVGSVPVLVFGNRVGRVREIPVLGAARQKVGPQVRVVEVSAGVDDGDDHVGVAPGDVPGIRRIDVGIDGAHDTVHGLRGVVHGPEPGKVRVVGDVLEGTVEADLAGLGEGNVVAVGEAADRLEQGTVLGNGHREVSGGALLGDHVAALFLEHAVDLVAIDSGAELHGEFVGEEVAGCPVLVDQYRDGVGNLGAVFQGPFGDAAVQAGLHVDGGETALVVGALADRQHGGRPHDVVELVGVDAGGEGDHLFVGLGGEIERAARGLIDVLEGVLRPNGVSCNSHGVLPSQPVETWRTQAPSTRRPTVTLTLRPSRRYQCARVVLLVRYHRATNIRAESSALKRMPRGRARTAARAPRACRLRGPGTGRRRRVVRSARPGP